MVLSSRFKRFLIVGGGNTALDFVLFYLLYTLLDWHVVLANICSYGTGLTCAFFINRAWTFTDSAQKDRSRVWLSLLFGYIGLGLNTVMIWGMGFVMHVYIAKVIAVLVIVFFNYYMNKKYVFKM